ncbi:MAG: hypothetical protein D3915_11170 [Candidatus Electrothrix sp. AU1_5]|nr:hypothetical protein [Candidatus Electrothrix gigas]
MLTEKLLSAILSVFLAFKIRHNMYKQEGTMYEQNKLTRRQFMALVPYNYHYIFLIFLLIIK